ncbi:MAG: hypothetical protein IPL55_10905 [Saprospiraceae bacterium]|nr:hypothetical protein [Saprospiraceae bacterium]
MSGWKAGNPLLPYQIRLIPLEKGIPGSIDKLKNSLETIIGRLQKY